MHQFQQRALSRAGVPRHEQHFASLDIESDRVQRNAPSGEPFGHIVESEQGHGSIHFDAVVHMAVENERLLPSPHSHMRMQMLVD
jgi:hypothetical protein